MATERTELAGIVPSLGIPERHTSRNPLAKRGLIGRATRTIGRGRRRRRVYSLLDP